MERAYFAETGIDLSRIEKQIHLQPGDLLVIDNLRCVHGRIGERRPKEVWQFLFGHEKTADLLVEKTRGYLAGSIADQVYERQSNKER